MLPAIDAYVPIYADHVDTGGVLSNTEKNNLYNFYRYSIIQGYLKSIITGLFNNTINNQNTNTYLRNAANMVAGLAGYTDSFTGNRDEGFTSLREKNEQEERDTSKATYMGILPNVGGTPADTKNYDSAALIWKKTFGVVAPKINESIPKFMRVKPPLLSIKSATKNNWIEFAFNTFSYTVVVLIIGIVGSNLTTLSKMRRTSNGYDGLENRLEKLFGSSIFAHDKLNIDESTNIQEASSGGPSNWCAACDLQVQSMLLLKEWPKKIFDFGNETTSSGLYKVFKTFIGSSGVFKNYIIPIMLLIMIYLQIPTMLGFFIAILASIQHPHWYVYWIGLLPLFVGFTGGNKTERGAKKFGIWTFICLLIAIITYDYVLKLSKAKDATEKEKDRRDDLEKNKPSGGGRRRRKRGGAGGRAGGRAEESLSLSEGGGSGGAGPSGGKSTNKNLVDFISARLPTSAGVWSALITSAKGLRTVGGDIRNVLKEGGEKVEDTLKLTKTIVAFLLIGWWLAPIWGLGTCLAYAFYVQIQFTLFVLFGSLKGKGAEEARTHIKNNRFGLTFMVVMMTSFSAIKSLTPQTSKPLMMALWTALIALRCCT